MKKPSIGILYGYDSKIELTEVGATHIVNELHHFCVDNSLIKK